MGDDHDEEVPEGAAVLPVIPEELGIGPLLLSAVHALVFLAGSDDEIVHPAAAEEAIQIIAGYLQRLDDADLKRVQEDMHCLTNYARQEDWPKQLVHSLKTLLADCGVKGLE